MNWVYRTNINMEKAFMIVVNLERKCIHNFIRAVSENVKMLSITLLKIIQLKEANFPNQNTFYSAEYCIIGSSTMREMIK